MKQKSVEWLKARHGKMTGSRISSVLGRNPWKDADGVLREMVREVNGLAPEFTGNTATRWGEKHEPDANNWVENSLGVLVQEHGLVMHPDYDWIAYSPDGTFIHNGERILLECKAPYSKKIPDQIPDYYMDQVQWGMEIMGIAKTLFVYLTPDQVNAIEVLRDPTFLETTLDIEADFMESYWAAITDTEPYL